MARKLVRKRWRRPQRLTLDDHVPARRKDLVVCDPMLLEPADIGRQIHNRISGALLVLIVLAALEGLIIAAPFRAWWLPGVFAINAVLFALAALQLGDGWIRTLLRTRPASAERTQRLLDGIVSDERPELLVIDGAAPNAFAGHGWIAVTEGVLALGPLEQEALLAREIAQIRSGDARFAGAMVTMTGGVGVRALGAKWGILTLLMLPVLPAVLVLRALVRTFVPAEYAERSDVAGALLVRYPPGMRGALLAGATTQPPSALRATDPFWAIPRTSAAADEARRRAAIVAEL